LWIDPQKIPISLAEENDFAFRVGDHDPIINVIENGFVKTDFFLESNEIFEFHRSSPSHPHPCLPADKFPLPRQGGGGLREGNFWLQSIIEKKDCEEEKVWNPLKFIFVERDNLKGTELNRLNL
jgi:hypothetical protein